MRRRVAQYQPNSVESMKEFQRMLDEGWLIDNLATGNYASGVSFLLVVWRKTAL